MRAVACGAAAGTPLGHAGRKSRIQRPWEGGQPLEKSAAIADWDAWELVAPSAIAFDDVSPAPRALERAEIRAIAEAWAKAAARAHAAGFDVVEIHGAHGFLIHQFLSPASNTREDEYGGPQQKRMRFALEGCEAVRASWPAEKPLFLRISAEDDAGFGPAQSVALAKAVKPLGVDVIDCSSGGLVPRPPALAPAYGYQVPYAEKIKKEAGIATMAVGLIGHAGQAEASLAEGRARLVALAREKLYNPNWALDAARKLGAGQSFAVVPPAAGWWLARRAATAPQVQPSTFGND